MVRRARVVALAAVGMAALVVLAILRTPSPASPGQAGGGLMLPLPVGSGRFELDFQAMGTDARLVVQAADAQEARRFTEGGVRAVRLVEREMSMFDPESELSRLNRLGAEQAVLLSPETMEVLRKAVEFSKLTGGAFDVTYAPLRTLWKAAAEEGSPPGPEAIASARERVGCDKLIFEGDAVRFAVPGVQVDLGGIAKGYGIELAAQAMMRAGAGAGLVDIGGDIRLFGRPADAERWRIEVQRPPGVEERVVLDLPACAVTTSGDYERGFRVGDQWFSHIMDPRTGRPVEGVPSVTVIAPDATTADALATGLSVLGAQEGVALADSLDGVECMMMTRAADGAVERHYSRGFQRYLEQ